MQPRAFISCFRHVARDESNATLQAPMFPPLREIVLDVSPAVVISDPFPAYTRFIQIMPETDVYVSIADRPSNDPKFMLREGERLFCGANEGYRISVK